MANITYGFGGRKISYLADRHTTLPGIAYSNDGGLATVERVPLICNLGNNTLLIVTQGSRDNAADYSYLWIIGRIATWALDSNGDPYITSVGDPYPIFTVPGYTEGTRWLNIGCLSSEFDDHPTTPKVHLLFTIVDGSGGVTTRPWAMHLYSSNPQLGASATWNTPAIGTYDGSGYHGGTDDISAQVIKFNNSTPAGQPTCYTASDGSLNEGWTFVSFGPGNIIKKPDGTLVAFGAHRYRLSGTAAQVMPWVHSVYSTDHGVTWALGGGMNEVVNNGNSSTVEPAAVLQNSSGDIRISARYVDTNATSRWGRRAMVTVTDNTSSWATATTSTDLGGADACGGMTKVSTGGDLYHTMISNVYTSQPLYRFHIGLWRSTDNGSSWTYKNCINGGWSGYSQLLCLDGTNFICCFESNRDHVEFASFAQQIAVCMFNKTWADASNVRTLTVPFNEATSGAIPTTGTPVRVYGDIYGGAVGGSGGTYTATGIAWDGTGRGAILQPAMLGNNTYDSANQRGGPFDFGLEAFTITFVGLKFASNIGIGKVIMSSRLSGTGSGITISGGTSGQITISGNDGTHTPSSKSTQANIWSTGLSRTIVISCTAAPSRSIRVWRDGQSSENDGAWVEMGTAQDWSSLTNGITGSGDLTLGTAVDGTNGQAGSCQGIIVERGIARTDTTTFKYVGNFVKPTWESYNNYTVWVPDAKAPETVFANLKTHILSTADRGWNCKVDTYGLQPGKVTPRPGDPINSLVDIKTPTRIWKPLNSGRGSIWADDATLGMVTRMQRVGAANGYWVSNGVSTSDYQFCSNGVFTIVFPKVRFYSETGSNQCMWDAGAGASLASGGLYIHRVNSSGALFVYLPSGNGTTWAINENTFGSSNGFTGLAVNTPYYVAIVGLGAGVKPKLYVGQWTSKTKSPTLTSYDSANNMGTVGGANAASTPTIGANNSATAVCDWLLADVIVARDSASLADLNKMADFARGPLAPKAKGYSYGYKYSY